MTNKSDFQTFLENAIWDRTWEEEGEILSYEVMTFEEAGILSNYNGLLVIAPDKLLNDRLLQFDLYLIYLFYILLMYLPERFFSVLFRQF